jgi:hypothetical protein
VSRFTDALVVSPLADGKTWVLVRSFGYEVGALGSGDVIDCRIGFMTDFAFIWRPFSLNHRGGSVVGTARFAEENH